MTPTPNSRIPLAPGTTGTAPALGSSALACLVAVLAVGGCGGRSEAGGSGVTQGTSTEGSSNGGSSRGSAANGSVSGVTTGGVSGQAVTSGSSTAATGFGSGGMTSTTGGIPSSGGAGGSNGSVSTSSGGAGGNLNWGGAAGAAGAAGTSGCEPQDAIGVGNCDAAFGVYFLGTSCGWVSGCSCDGADCDDNYQDQASCEHANRGCLSDCAPQDATLVGDCIPSAIHYFNGVACTPMVGCVCVGDDCEAGYGAEQERCLEAHAVCEDRVRSCAEIEAVYTEYVSHTACAEDSDCAIITGACGVGLGGCYHALNRRWDEDGLAVLAEAFTQGGCSGAVCDCGPPPDAAVCENGVCVPEP